MDTDSRKLSKRSRKTDWNSCLPSRMPELDGVRAFAVLLILAFHSLPQGSLPFGWTGVNLFFVLSGFLITGILLDSKRICAGTTYFRSFYARRTLRIFPIYYLVILLALILGLRRNWPTADWPYYMTYSQNFVINWISDSSHTLFPGFINHTWSLAVEEQFYLIWPLVVYLLSRRSLSVMCVILIIGAPIFRFWVLGMYPDTMYYYILLPSQVDSLAIGAILALAVRRWSLSQLRSVYVPYGMITVMVLAALFILPSTDMLRRILIPQFCLVFLALPLFFSRSLPAVICRLASVRYVGRISYGLYLYHPLAFHFVGAALARHPAIREQLGVAGEHSLKLGITFLVAGGSWHFLESPINRLKRHFEYRGIRAKYQASGAMVSPSNREFTFVKVPANALTENQP